VARTEESPPNSSCVRLGSTRYSRRVSIEGLSRGQTTTVCLPHRSSACSPRWTSIRPLFPWRPCLLIHPCARCALRPRLLHPSRSRNLHQRWSRPRPRRLPANQCLHLHPHLLRHFSVPLNRLAALPYQTAAGSVSRRPGLRRVMGPRVEREGSCRAQGASLQTTVDRCL
jgi:hypothetical protein